jgi:hypothetical protein
MGGARSTLWGGEMHTIVWLQNMKVRDHLKDTDVEKITLEWIIGI